jgi:hypothetical protein
LRFRTSTLPMTVSIRGRASTRYQDELYDLVLTSVARPFAGDRVGRLHRDAQHAAAVAELLADTALLLPIGTDPSGFE